MPVHIGSQHPLVSRVRKGGMVLGQKKNIVRFFVFLTLGANDRFVHLYSGIYQRHMYESSSIGPLCLYMGKLSEACWIFKITLVQL